MKNTIDNIKIIGVTKAINTIINHIIEIDRGAIRPNIPSKKIRVSRSHMFNINGKHKQAHQLLSNQKVNKIPYNGDVLYNILLEKHHYIKVENMLAETLHPNNPIALLHKNVIWNANIKNICKEAQINDVNNKSNSCSILNRTFTHLKFNPVNNKPTK